MSFGFSSTFIPFIMKFFISLCYSFIGVLWEKTVVKSKQNLTWIASLQIIHLFITTVSLIKIQCCTFDSFPVLHFSLYRFLLCFLNRFLHIIFMLSKVMSRLTPARTSSLETFVCLLEELFMSLIFFFFFFGTPSSPSRYFVSQFVKKV